MTAVLPLQLQCPRCGHAVRRVRRHLVDRLVGWFWPRNRFRCAVDACGWEGLMRGRGRHAYLPRRRLDAAQEAPTRER